MELNTRFIKVTLVMIAVGIWVLIFQNAGIIPQVSPRRISVDSALRVTGSVDVDNTVFIKGSVDANIESINGYSKFYKDPRTGEFYVIPVTDPYE
ncbi:hypothetical protein LA303_08370 [Candidatus Sulfidibacterium hydrothermale]|uniref:hypothetical protein n=1 Tax=Candidatus Sulfidibacterium hydrothermale TaxID=2875962 RepID=UPI001F0AD471|nr:hypothetical protein [Candidatus Sulfidibacterium hydrothermale]UBM61433.1 hypothetical protein LA303_08370 [Candidatus Sulfidibacterium hydrothermale]